MKENPEDCYLSNEQIVKKYYKPVYNQMNFNNKAQINQNQNMYYNGNGNINKCYYNNQIQANKKNYQNNNYYNNYANNNMNKSK